MAVLPLPVLLLSERMITDGRVVAAGGVVQEQRSMAVLPPVLTELPVVLRCASASKPMAVFRCRWCC